MVLDVTAETISARSILVGVGVGESLDTNTTQLLLTAPELKSFEPDFFMLAPWGISVNEDTNEPMTGRLESFYPGTKKTTNNVDPALGIIRTIGTSLLPIDKSALMFIPSADKWSKPYKEDLAKRGYTNIEGNDTTNTTFEEALAQVRFMHDKQVVKSVTLTDSLQGPRQELMFLVALKALGCEQTLEGRAESAFDLIQNNPGWNIFRDQKIIDRLKQNQPNNIDLSHTLDMVHAVAERHPEIITRARKSFDSIVQQFLINTGVDINAFVPPETQQGVRDMQLDARYIYTDHQIDAQTSKFAQDTIDRWLASDEGLIARAMNLKGVVDIMLGTYYTQDKNAKRNAEDVFIRNGQFDVFYQFGAISRISKSSPVRWGNS